MAGAGIAAAFGFVFVLGTLGNSFSTPPPELGGPPIFAEPNVTSAMPLMLTTSQQLKKFADDGELRSFLLGLDQNRGQIGGSIRDFELGPSSPNGSDDLLARAPTSSEAPDQQESDPASSSTVPGAPGYSTTNVQVQGVDEADFLKNDGTYVYILSGDTLTIVKAYPAEEAKAVTKVALDIQEGQYLQDMFLDNNTLVIFYQEYGQDYVIQQYDYRPTPVNSQKTHALLMDISDRESPKVLRDYAVTGSYSNARMIGSQIYLVTSSELYDYGHPIIPKVMESSSTIVRPDVYYFDNPELNYAFNTVTSINLDASGTDPSESIQSQTYMMNPSSTLYVSQDSIYVAYPKNIPYNYNYYYQGTSGRERFFEVIVPLLPGRTQDAIDEIEQDDSLTASQKWDKVSLLLEDTYNGMSKADRDQLFKDINTAIQDYDTQIQKESQKTVIHRFAIGPDGTIEYVARGEVPGNLLNQFSMDESGDRFRVATTSDFWSQSSSSSSSGGGSVIHNNIYVLDRDNMEIVGELEEIADGESIYSARFMGDRLYLVTFERTDPFFVIDLSEDNPKVLGELKLPGYSNYLHPYDQEHIIGIGKETAENRYGGIETLGVKIALFDVSDIHNPLLVDEFEIGGSGTESEVLYDHKALLFDRAQDVLSLPIFMRPEYAASYAPDGRYVPPETWRGFYVFSVDPEDGFDLKGRIEHRNDAGDDDYYYANYPREGSRSFYIGDVLYTVTIDNLIKMNDLGTLDEINQVELGNSGRAIPYPMPVDSGISTDAPPAREDQLP
ncbi:MAG TPA: beta-propeller domain-containing protein [Nitrososphaera sp.]|nr:beta-propeller domain-containing protein [Nitrososphaera sp.]